MEKKYSIILVIIVLIIIGLIGHVFLFNSQKTVDVGDTCFTLPDGYSIGNLNKDGDINITNGDSDIFINEYNDNNIDKHIDKYLASVNKTNYTFEYSNFTINNNSISRVDVEGKTVHYWFIINEKVYTIYSWNENDDLDSIVLGLIKSAKSKN